MNILGVEDAQGNSVPPPYIVTLNDENGTFYISVENPDYWKQPQPVGLGGSPLLRAGYMQLLPADPAMNPVNVRTAWEGDRIKMPAQITPGTYTLAAIWNNYPTYRELTTLRWQNPRLNP